MSSCVRSVALPGCLSRQVRTQSMELGEPLHYSCCHQFQHVFIMTLKSPIKSTCPSPECSAAHQPSCYKNHPLSQRYLSLLVRGHYLRQHKSYLSVVIVMIRSRTSLGISVSFPTKLFIVANPVPDFILSPTGSKYCQVIEAIRLRKPCFTKLCAATSAQYLSSFRAT